MKVQCKCGWSGDSESLVNLAGGYYLHCPECSADFVPYRASEPTSGVAHGKPSEFANPQ